MNQKLLTICLVLITLGILVGVGFYSWSVVEKQKYYQYQKIEKSFKEGVESLGK